MAIHYLCPGKSYLLTTNYKVWFSTLEAMPGLQHVDAERVLRNLTERQRPDGGLPHYLLTRNPYTRLESFFRDKFRQHPADVKPDQLQEWQHCQKCFFGPMGIRAEDSVEAVRLKLLGVSFDEFLTWLPPVAHMDGHLTPQIEARQVQTATGQTGMLTFDKCIRTEAAFAADRSFLTEVLGINVSIVRNHTWEVREPLVWTPPMRAIANSVYATDFDLFDYPMWQE